MTKIRLATEHRNIFHYLQEVELLDNKNAVELLIKRYKIPHINLNSEAIKAVDFDKINDYCQNGYFIFEDIKGNRCCAINNISLIQKKISNFLQNTKIFLVREGDFYSILERDFAVDNTLNAIECLTNINPKASAKSINYPKSRLDVKFIIEADDQMTIRALAGLSIPSYIHVIKVPCSLPRTKPKALNYAMAFVLGEYLTVYDAEDEPDPEQLLKAVAIFSTLPQNYVCLQSKLNFYNANENFLTRCFSIEYSIWFEYLLRGLSLFDLPLTLGGTSNHFKVDKLREVGLWDAYNVTEDADLGIRLYLKGYKVSMIDSTTLEEAPNNLTDWIGQRARWIKGFIQTIYVFIQAKKDYTKLGLLKIAAVYIFVGLSTYSFFFLPWLILLMYLDLHPIIYYLWLVNSFFSLSYMYTIAYIVTSNGTSPVTLRSISDILVLIFWPLYFVLHTIASYRALWETISSPFKWNKTPHGTSNIDDIVEN